MVLTSDETAALILGPPRLAIFLKLAVTPALNCWLALGPIDIPIGTSVLDPSGATYQGFGQLLNVPVLQQLINGTADRAEIGLSGLDPAILTLANSAPDVQGKTCDFGFAIMGSDWQLIGNVHWSRRYFADYLKIAVTPASQPGEVTVKSAILSIRSQMTGRRRAGLSYFTNQDQQSISPTDRFCERTNQYSIIGSKTWPRSF